MVPALSLFVRLCVCSFVSSFVRSFVRSWVGGCGGVGVALELLWTLLEHLLNLPPLTPHPKSLEVVCSCVGMFGAVGGLLGPS